MSRTRTAKYNEDVSVLVKSYLDGYTNNVRFIDSMTELLEGAWYDDEISPDEYRLILTRIYPMSIIYTEQRDNYLTFDELVKIYSYIEECFPEEYWISDYYHTYKEVEGIMRGYCFALNARTTAGQQEHFEDYLYRKSLLKSEE